MLYEDSGLLIDRGCTPGLSLWFMLTDTSEACRKKEFDAQGKRAASFLFLVLSLMLPVKKGQSALQHRGRWIPGNSSIIIYICCINNKIHVYYTMHEHHHGIRQRRGSPAAKMPDRSR